MYYFVRKITNLTVTPTRSVSEAGDHLKCMAHGNPSPNYEWTDLQTNRVINGSVLIIDDYMKSGQNHSFRCTAYNIVAGCRKQLSDTIGFMGAGGNSNRKYFRSKLDLDYIVSPSYTFTHSLT